VEYVHLNPVRAGLVRRAEDWRWSSFNDYNGSSASGGRILTIDRVRMPAEPRDRI